MRNTFDNVNLGMATAFWGSILGGWKINDYAAAAALVYSLILIGHKAWQFCRWLRTRA
ncbi:hypothetical protein ACN9MB_13140 [Dyella kyungheensis]|uniref:hypothetical protein n=1 Tax=Dyella kyungheensis TaxID=1242174 RepID=UPI003CE6C190